MHQVHAIRRIPITYAYSTVLVRTRIPQTLAPKSSYTKPFHVDLIRISSHLYSTLNDTNPKDPYEGASLFNRLQLFLLPYTNGTKQLFRENKIAWQLRSQQKNDPTMKLTRSQALSIRQAPQDLLKSLPFICVFAIPLVGYLAPFIGHKYPKQFLPAQFWLPEQKTQFYAERVATRTLYYHDVREFMYQILAKSKQNQSKEMKETPQHPVYLLQWLQELKNSSTFMKLEDYSQEHVMTLAYASAIVPGFDMFQMPKSIFRTLFSQTRVIRWLQTFGEDLYHDDQYLRLEGIDSLSLEELQFACQNRGIAVAYDNIDALKAALTQWLSVYDSGEVPITFLLHAPALTDEKS